MREFDPNRLMSLAALVIMLLIAAASGYRVSIGSGGLIFDRATPVAAINR
jgi:hypothetical protein